MDRLFELEERIDEYRKHAHSAEEAALQKLKEFPPFDKPLSEVEVLRRELLRHHTRVLLLDELTQWITELKGLRLYQLCTLPNAEHAELRRYAVHQYMTEQEVTEVNATFEANNERLRWRLVEEPVELVEEPVERDAQRYSFLEDHDNL
jgi:hypothetical protein